MGARLKRSLGMAYTANASQFMAQMERAAVVKRIYLRMLAEAGRHGRVASAGRNAYGRRRAHLA